MLFQAILGHPLIQADDTWGLLGVMCLSVALAIWLEQKYRWASRVSGAIIALIIAVVMANLGVIPTSSVLYDDVVWGVIVPMGIPLLLLQCNLKAIGKRTGKMLAVFLIGALGTIVGAFAAYFTLRGAYVATGGTASDLAAVASMMTGSYIGGGVNFAAMAANTKLDGTVVSATTVADNLLMALYFFVLIACAGLRFFRKHFDHPHIDQVESGSADQEAACTQAAAFWSRKDISLKDVAMNIAYAVVVAWVSGIIAGAFAPASPETVSSLKDAMMDFVGKFLGSQYVWITTISVFVATAFDKKVEQLHGSQEIGTYLIYLFLFVIGVPANIMTVITTAPLLLVFCFIMVVVNMAFCFVGAKLSKGTLEDAIIASNANIGGPTTAAGMAISQGWTALVGPAMLVGVLGYVVGNYAGTIVGMVLGA